MKFACESEWYSSNPEYGSSCEKILVYDLEGDDYYDLDELIENGKRAEILDGLGLYSDWNVPPGARFTRFHVIALTSDHLIVSRRDSYNV